MNRATAESNITAFPSFAERTTRGTAAGKLRGQARLALARGQKEAFLADLSGYVDAVLGNRALVIQQELAGGLSETPSRPVRRFRLLQGGKP